MLAALVPRPMRDVAELADGIPRLAPYAGFPTAINALLALRDGLVSGDDQKRPSQ